MSRKNYYSLIQNSYYVIKKNNSDKRGQKKKGTQVFNTYVPFYLD